VDRRTPSSPGYEPPGETPPAPGLPDEIAELRSRLTAREARLAEVEAELDAVHRVRAAELRHLDTRIADLEKLYLQLLERDERIADLEAALERSAGGETFPGETPGSFVSWEAWFRRRLLERADAETERLREAVTQQRRVLDEKETLIRRLLERLGISASEATGPDDLKQISGIGPSIERTLHGLGITTFEQIAGFDDAAIDRVAAELGAFDYRVRSDNWVDQAAELAQRKAARGLLLPSAEPR
jgi:predicted flap endonuclease-1-like 5' DNA nuclease